MKTFSAELVAEDGSRISLEAEQQVGRSGSCRICIDDGRISRIHAVVRVANQRVTVEDLGSANGTRVNGLQAKGAVTLADSDTVSFDRHCYVVVIRGAVPDPDATVVKPDATALADLDRDTADYAPAGAGAPSPAPRAAAGAPATAAIPGSWVDSGTANQTRVLSLDAITGGAAAAETERASDLPHLVVLGGDGSLAGAVELQTSGGQDLWEIGREPPCEIVLNEASVSERHAQLIHQDGRWRLVNLVSTNGIFVNGEKKLTAYLTEGDHIRLGLVTLVFRAAAGGAAPACTTDGPTPEARVAGSKHRLAVVAAVVITVLLAVLAWVMK